MTAESIYEELNIRVNDGDEEQEHDQSGNGHSENDILFGV
jgi:hypothetical protein